MRSIGSRIHLDAKLVRPKVEASLARVALAEEIDRPPRPCLMRTSDS